MAERDGAAATHGAISPRRHCPSSTIQWARTNRDRDTSSRSNPRCAVGGRVDSESDLLEGRPESCRCPAGSPVPPAQGRPVRFGAGHLTQGVPSYGTYTGDPPPGLTIGGTSSGGQSVRSGGVRWCGPLRFGACGVPTASSRGGSVTTRSTSSWSSPMGGLVRARSVHMPMPHTTDTRSKTPPSGKCRQISGPSLRAPSPLAPLGARYCSVARLVPAPRPRARSATGFLRTDGMPGHEAEPSGALVWALLKARGSCFPLEMMYLDVKILFMREEAS